MTLIAILLCLAVQRIANFSVLNIVWFNSYIKFLSQWIIKSNAWIGLAIIIVPMFLILAVLQFLFSEFLFGIFGLIFITCVLFFCIDARDFKNSLVDYFTRITENDIKKASNGARNVINNEHFADSNKLTRAVTIGILVESFERFFIGIFWFAVFGIYGIVGYFVINLLRKDELNLGPNYIGIIKLAEKIQTMLAWVPSRLIGISYALVGNFSKGFSYFSANMLIPLTENNKFVINSGLSSLDVKEDISLIDAQENYSAIDLVNHALIIWIVVIALVSLGIWL